MIGRIGGTDDLSDALAGELAGQAFSRRQAP